MAYIRPKNMVAMGKTEKIALLKEYAAYYEKAVQERGLEALNVKIPREVFASVLDEIGELLLSHASQLLCTNADVQVFLKQNPLPRHMEELLPDEFRVFSLLLNSLKQWISAESAATDRFLLGGTARQTCREAVTHCIVTGERLGEGAELHHPVRDGRPPVLLSKKGHEIVEQAVASVTATVAPGSSTLTGAEHMLWQRLQAMRSQRNQSWAQLREGCQHLLNSLKPCRPNAKTFANVVIRETGKTPSYLIHLLDLVGK